MTRPVMEKAEVMLSRVEQMIAIQEAAYPDGWSDADKREMAIHHLFGSAWTHEGAAQSGRVEQ